MTWWSFLVGLSGVAVSMALSWFLRKHRPDAEPRLHWILGVAALFPAWLIAFLALLPSATEKMADVPLPPPAIFSSGAALFGIILTEYAQRRLQKPAQGRGATAYWLFGLISLFPGWVIALVSLR